MIKKALLPAMFASALALTACNTDNGALPDNNETPMQDMERNNTPNDNTRMGPDLDGLDDNRDNGIMNRDRGNVIDDNNRDMRDENRNGGGLMDESDGLLNDEEDDGLLDGDKRNSGARDDNTTQGEMKGNNAAPDDVIRDKDRNR